jgi:hypothetical protein
MATAMLTRLALPALRRRAATSRVTSQSLKHPQWRSLSSSCAGATSQAAKATAPNDKQAASLALLEKSIALRQSTRALAYFNQLEQLPSTRVLQKLAVLLAKQPSRAHSTRAFDILLSVYKCVHIIRPSRVVHRILTSVSIYGRRAGSRGSRRTTTRAWHPST